MRLAPFSRFRRNPWLLLILIGLFADLGLAEPSERNAPVPSDPVFSVLLTSGETLKGRIRQLGDDGSLTIALDDDSPKERTFAQAEVVKLSRTGIGVTPVPEKQLVLLPEGDRLFRAEIGAADETKLNVQSLGFGKLAIPLENLAGLVLQPPEQEDAVFNLIHKVLAEPDGAELIWLAPNGDRMNGSFLGLDDQALKFESSTGPISLERSKLIALGFDPKIVTYPLPKEGFYELTTTDNSRLGVERLKLDQGILEGTTRFGQPVKIALNDLVHIHSRSSSVSYLGDREAADVRYVGYVGPTRPYQRNRSVEGKTLRLADQVYDRGLGTQSRTLLAYRLEPGDRRFQTLIGVDDRAGPLSSVVFRVLVDSKEQFRSEPLASHDEPVAIDLDVEGGKLLILITEFGARGEVRDFANWVEARLIR